MRPPAPGLTGGYGGLLRGPPLGAQAASARPGRPADRRPTSSRLTARGPQGRARQRKPGARVATGEANHGAPGIDGVTVEGFPTHARTHWPVLCAQIEQGRYRPAGGAKGGNPQADGGQHLIGIPTVTDRVIQQAIAQVLTPIFQTPRLPDSASRGYKLGCLPRLTCQTASTSSVSCLSRK